MLENQQTFLNLVTSNKIKLVNIGAEDLSEGKPTLVLGLTWTLILHFEIHKYSTDEQQLLRWVRAKTSGYDEVSIQSWGTGFNDGKAFCALIHKHEASALDFVAACRMEPVETLTHAFNVAEETFAVPKLLEPQDLVGGNDFDDDDDATTQARARARGLASRRAILSCPPSSHLSLSSRTHSLSSLSPSLSPSLSLSLSLSLTLSLISLVFLSLPLSLAPLSFSVFFGPPPFPLALPQTISRSPVPPQTISRSPVPPQ
eukprot:6182045-Pleurochrysis_carterae.AAC.5